MKYQALWALLVLTMVSLARGAERNVRATDVAINWQQTNCLSIVLEAQGNENALGFSLCFDTNLLQYTSARRGSGASAASLNVNTNQASRGRLGLALALSSGDVFPAGAASIVEVCFRARAGHGVASTAISFCDLPIAREVVDMEAGDLDTTYTDGRVGLMGACPFSLQSNGASFDSGGGQGTVAVQTDEGCPWDVINGNNWIAFSPEGGAGPGILTYSVAPHAGFTPRAGEMTIGGQVFTVIQAGLPCAYSLDLTERTHSREAESGFFNVLTGPTCSWSVNNTNNWIQITSGASGVGNGAIRYSLLTNSTANGRRGVVTVAGQAFTVTQLGPPCTYSLNPTSRVHTYFAEAAVVNVTAPVGCDWIIVNTNDWMIIKLYTNGTGSDIARYSIFDNTHPVARSGVLWIAGQPYTVYQGPAPCIFTLLRTNQSFPPTYSTGVVTVATAPECPWSATSSVNWIHILTGSNGIGGGAVTFEVESNPTPSDRSGVITVGGKFFVANQLAGFCQYNISPTGRAHGTAMSTGTVSVSASYASPSVPTNTLCEWMMVSSESWIFPVSGVFGTDDATARYGVRANLNGAARTGILRVAGRNFTISQAGVPCTYAITPPSRTHAYLAETGSITMTAVNGCSWNAGSSAPWISFIGPSTGVGSGGVTYRVDVNTGDTRSGTVTMGGRVFSITQTAASAVTFTTPPPNRNVLAGGTTTFGVAVTGLPPFSYQWQCNGANLVEGPSIIGTRTPTLTLLNLQANQAGNYVVVVSNLRGGTASPPGVLRVNTAPKLTVPANRTVNRGNLLAFSASTVDPDIPAQTLTYSLVNAPAGATINASSGLFTWTPAASVGLGVSNVTILVTDNGFTPLSDVKTCAITIVGGLATNRTLVSTGAVWRYRDTGEDLGTAWRIPSFNDATWASGPALLGYGNGTESTVVGFGPDPNNIYVTTYFRRHFTLGNAGVLNSLNMAVRFDDAVIVYLNGVEVFRRNLPAGPVNYLTLASASVGSSEELLYVASPPLDPGYLVAGDNVVAAEVHQRNTSNSDLGFDMWLTGSQSVSVPSIVTQPESQGVPPGTTVTFRVSADDLLPLRYQWYFRDAPVAGATNATLVLPSVQSAQEGNYYVAIANSLGSATSVVASLTVVTSVPNTAPLLAAIGPKSINEGATLTFTALATDAQVPAQHLTFSLDPGAPVGATINPTSGVFTWTPAPEQGPSQNFVTVRVFDNGTPSLSDFETINIVVLESNQPPVLAAIGSKSVTEGAVLSFFASATDPNQPGQQLTFSLDAGAPAGAVIHPNTGLFSWVPTELQGPATNLITIRVSDNGSPALSDAETISVIVRETNNTPVITFTGDKIVAEGTLLTFTVNATDSDQPPQRLAFTLAPGAPAGAAINNTNGIFTWTPNSAQAPSTNTVTIRVSDSGPPVLTASETITIVVVETNFPPVLNPIGNKSVDEGSLLSFTVSASDVDQPAQQLTFSLAPGAPSGATIQPGTGLFMWTPAETDGPSTNTVTIRVTDSGVIPSTTSETIRITVNEINTAPLLAAIPPQSVIKGGTLSFTASATDADRPAQALVFSLDAGAPLGAGIHPATGLFSWAPYGAQPTGTVSVTVRVTDNASPPLSAVQTVPISVIAGFTTNFTLIPTGAVWRYRDTGENLGTAWTAPNYDDRAWAAGAAKLGYGNADDATVVGYGTNSAARYITTYFRDRFVVSDPRIYGSLQLQVLRDDGVVIYLNGSEIYRDNMPPGPINYLTTAPTNVDALDELIYYPSPPLDPRYLVAGTNVLAVELHQKSAGSSDLGFNLELVGTATPVMNTPPQLGPIGNRIVTEGSTLTFFASALDSDLPAQSLTFSLDPGAPSGASIHPVTGVFTWSPATGQAPATNAVTVRVTDNGLPPLSDLETVLITVDKLKQVTFVVARVNGQRNAQVAVPILASRFSNITSFQYTLHWDSTVASFLGAEAVGVPGIIFGTNDAVNGTVTVRWNDPSGTGVTLAEASTLFMLNLRLIGAPGSASSLFVVGSPLPMGASSSDSQPVAVSVIPGTIFVDASATPLIAITIGSAGAVQLRWDTIPGRHYQVQYTTKLPAAGWTNLGSELVAGGSGITLSDPLGVLQQRFYRIRIIE